MSAFWILPLTLSSLIVWSSLKKKKQKTLISTERRKKHGKFRCRKLEGFLRFSIRLSNDTCNGWGNGRKPLLVPGVGASESREQCWEAELHSVDRNVGQQINSPAVLLWSQHTRILPFWTQQGLARACPASSFGLRFPPSSLDAVPGFRTWAGSAVWGRCSKPNIPRHPGWDAEGRWGARGQHLSTLGRPASPLLEMVPWKQWGNLSLLDHFQMWWT